MNDGVNFAGHGAMDASISKNGTEPPTASQEGTNGGVEFVGNGNADITGNSSNTMQHDPSKHDISGSGSKGVDFVAE